MLTFHLPAALLLVLTVSNTAVAQTAGSAAGYQAPAPTVVVVNQPPAYPSQPQSEVSRREDPDSMRLRFGIALDGDLIAAPGLIGLGVGLTVRLGAQFNQWFGLYYQPHGIVGGWLTEGAGGVVAELQNAFNLELTLPFLHIGVGPSIDILAVAGCGDTGGGAGCVSGDAAFFGLDTRVAVVLGAVGRGSRGGFSINAHIHPTFVGSNVVWTIALGVGGEVY